MVSKNTYYLVGNAHLDPVWQWRWQEGSMEAKATIRSALDRMIEFPEFRFVCSSASVFQWVEEFAPDMLEEIKQRVKEGRFVIVGGCHVQPDCNLPSGEGFSRQFLYAQRYFKETFGVTAKVGYNVDSFGHSLMLPQILKKSGMDSYIFMRPGPHEKEMESDLFTWISPDGSAVTTYRILDPYCFKFNSTEELEERCEYLDKNAQIDSDKIPLFYGVGNHGGGPTIRNLEVLRDFANQHTEKTLIYSNLEDFFDAVRAENKQIPEHQDDLQHHAAGCYAAVSAVKNGIRRAEENLVAAERFSILASWLCKKQSRTKVFEESWKNVCFCHFHDIMDGCCIKEAYEDAGYILGAAQHTAAVEENNALQTISWCIDTSAMSKGLPVVVFNPHSFQVTQLVQVNKQCTAVRDCQGNAIPFQLVHATSYECYGLKDTLFEATVPALGYAVYYLQDYPKDMPEQDNKIQSGIESEVWEVNAKKWSGFISANEHGGTVLENEIYRIQFEAYSGYITSFVEKATGNELIAGRAAVPVVIDEYYHDAWSHAKNFFTDEMARFSDATVSVVENGPVRATVKVESRYNNSVLTQYFSLTSHSEKLEVRAFVDWHEHHKMLKLAWPMAVDNPKAFYEIPYGVIERPADGEEEPGLMWTAVKGDNGGFALVNNNTYSSSVKGNTIYQTVLRSPIYGDHGGPRTEESDFTDQGRKDFSYIMMPIKTGWSSVVQQGKQLNKPLTVIVETWHTGSLKAQKYEGLSVDQPNIMLSALKYSEDGTGLILRVYELEGKETNVRISGNSLPAQLDTLVGPWAVETYYLKNNTNQWKKVLMSEYEMDN